MIIDRQTPTTQTQRYKKYFTSKIRTCARVGDQFKMLALVDWFIGG